MSRERIIQTAAAENGTTENPPNSNLNKFGAWYGMNGVKWCAIFVSYVFDKAGLPLGTIDSPKGFHYCPSAYNFWKRKKQLTSTPQPGDIVLFDWDGDALSDHTGIFAEWITPGKMFKAWEGNTSINNNSNGGQVMLRTRTVNVVKAFVNPGVFGDLTVQPKDSVQRGDRGASVTRIQKLLYDLEFNISVDGDFGSVTEKAVKQFQQEKRLTPTGIVDDITLGALQAEASKPNVPDSQYISGTFLKKGDAGAAVVLLQKALNKKRAKLDADGVFGEYTFNALKAFQKKNKLKADGIAGPETWKALNKK